MTASDYKKNVIIDYNPDRTIFDSLNEKINAIDTEGSTHVVEGTDALTDADVNDILKES